MAGIAINNHSHSSDFYGFPLNLSLQQQAERLEVNKKDEKHSTDWASVVQKQQLPHEDRLKKLVRKGVPKEQRYWIWLECSGANEKRKKYATNYYHHMLTAGQGAANEENARQIDLDVPRTFPSHQWLNTQEGQLMLRNILIAFSAHCEQIGYCQSMNYVAAMLLLAMNKKEDDAFWMMVTLIGDILYPGTYSQNLKGCHVEMRSLDELVAKKLPRLHAHLRELGCDISIIATDWYLCLFSTSLPAESVCRVWDALFNEGPKILFRVALAVLLMHEPVLLTKDNAGELLRACKDGAVHVHDHYQLMHAAFKGIGSMPMATIDKFREAKSMDVEQMLRERDARRRTANGQQPSPVEDDEQSESGSSAACNIQGSVNRLVNNMRGGLRLGFGMKADSPSPSNGHQS